MYTSDNFDTGWHATHDTAVISNNLNMLTILSFFSSSSPSCSRRPSPSHLVAFSQSPLVQSLSDSSAEQLIA